ncbi:hypothetical protein CkaCkLH20_10602 [Colletotrichum karsti]|uniref:2EXR domain-containing protein n=1 Tax=Colletotrichum karsti TaxID=1095194 RepID=A0A9P6HXJ6_9PEZI|nr:uncharacterized protein CkaCkLH20_10602 [Colletotrichum karsti]KAF9871970.1 hypothetical protein CkaCkLH20_10602 [Colletotrichum karsti]
MSTFHSFTCLPNELRARIWALSIEPRTVEVRVNYENQVLLGTGTENNWRRLVRQVISPTPVPAVLQVCKESRTQGLYQKECFESNSRDVYDGERRYLWLNFNIDMVSIGPTGFADLITIAPRIKRLKFDRMNSDEGFYHFEVHELRNFVNLEEVHVVCSDGLQAWWGAAEDHYWPCGQQNLFFIDPENGQMVRSIEMDIMFDEKMKAEWAKDGFEYPSGEPIR